MAVRIAGNICIQFVGVKIAYESNSFKASSNLAVTDEEMVTVDLNHDVHTGNGTCTA